MVLLDGLAARVGVVSPSTTTVSGETSLQRRRTFVVRGVTSV
jgi:hypothetical protein